MVNNWAVLLLALGVACAALMAIAYLTDGWNEEDADGESVDDDY